MNGRNLVSLLASLTLLATGLAGCLETPSFLTQTDAEASALENKDLADSAAAAWNPDALLVGVGTVEASEEVAAMSEGMFVADPAVGNGRALLWFYAYQAPESKDLRVFRVDADGRIQVENTSMVPMDQVPQMDPITSWGIDSDAALQAAAADERVAKALATQNVSVGSGLGIHEGVLVWGIAAFAENKIVFAAVDATSGSLINVEAVDMSQMEVPDMPAYPGQTYNPVLHVEGEGSLDGATSTKEHPFVFEGRRATALLQVQAYSQLPTDRLVWTLVGPDGEEVDMGQAGRLLTPGSVSTFEIELEEPGEYVLVMEYSSRAMLPLGGVDYEFTLDSPIVEHDE